MYISNDLIDDYCHIQHGRGTNEMMVPSNKLFVRSLSEFNDVEEHDKFEEYKDFLSNRHECSICTDRKDGQYFCERCRECDDGSGLFCKDCVTEYCQTLLSEGRVTQLSCPATSCKRLLPDDLVKSLLSTQLYDKYIKMRDEVHLDLIPGMVYCPRSTCRSRIASEPQSDLAICSICQFPFCKLCRQTWHGIEPCHILSQINDKDDSNNDSTKNTKQHKTEEEIKRKVEELKVLLLLLFYLYVCGIYSI
jgi:E3 ubiquitin-protein ligase RNF14